ncbi:hypothetical protein [Chryseobacterium paridis]|uniref:Nuclear transport factor 2 family protein n=1 Tax=Chryseobacterium paridis TaxID=2800328 RepID=A0ABS1FXP1_9FLAO|nr:hypothetical protein [Chryseobacterium paridis]MBK1897018.1 hypothetical protein [Chryseobacterium paridis]
MTKKELVQKEILDFHQNIENWFKGKTNDKEVLQDVMLQNFHPYFRMKGMAGNEVDYEGLSGWLLKAFGRFPKMKIEISEIKIQLSHQHALAEYIETQNTGEEVNIRKSSAIFLLNSIDSVSWYHLLEQRV